MASAWASWQSFILPAVGAGLGLVLGLVFTDTARATDSFGGWLVVLVGVGVVAAGATYVLKRRDAALHDAAPRLRAGGGRARTPAAAPPATAGATASTAAPRLDLAIALPAIASRHPDVWGAGDPLDVVVRARRGGQAVADVPVALAYVNGNARTDLGEVKTGIDGNAPFRFSHPAPDTVVLEASVRGDDRVHRVERAVRLVRYDEEIATIFDEFRNWANTTYPDAGEALTAREMFQAVGKHVGADASKALLDVTRAYELVAYGDREARRDTYEAVLEAFSSLEGAGVFRTPSTER